MRRAAESHSGNPAALALLTLVLASVGGCAAPNREDSWAYTGADPGLRSSMRSIRTVDDFEAWRQQVRQAVDDAKDDCARRTGESRSPGLWLGYGDAFIACMKAQGWTRVSNPL